MLSHVYGSFTLLHQMDSKKTYTVATQTNRTEVQEEFIWNPNQR
jgi:hypothetical protein